MTRDSSIADPIAMTEVATTSVAAIAPNTPRRRPRSWLCHHGPLTSKKSTWQDAPGMEGRGCRWLVVLGALSSCATQMSVWPGDEPPHLGQIDVESCVFEGNMDAFVFSVMPKCATTGDLDIEVRTRRERLLVYKGTVRDRPMLPPQPARFVIDPFNPQNRGSELELLLETECDSGVFRRAVAHMICAVR